VGVLVFVEKIFLDYDHTALGFAKPEQGDKAISVLKSAVASLRPEDRFDTYRVLSVTDRSNFWTAHCRKV
jgi:hypothetical protein